VFGLVFVPNLLQAQDASPPQTYSLTQTDSRFVEGLTKKIYRDGSKALIDRSYPPRAKNPKGMHIRTLYDLQAHTQYTWDLLDTSVPCGAGTFSGDWDDPFAFSAQLLSESAKGKPKVMGREMMNGIETKVLEAAAPNGPGKGRLWLDEKYGLIIKWQVISANSQARTLLEVKELSLAKPLASLFVLPPACAKTEITGHSSSSTTGGHAETQLTVPPSAASQKGPPQDAPSQESASQILAGTHVSTDHPKIKLKLEEQVALIFLSDIRSMEANGCSLHLKRLCSLDELIKRVKVAGVTVGFMRNPDEDSNYRYTVTIISNDEYETAAIPRRAGLSGFLFHIKKRFGDTYYNPKGAATVKDQKLGGILIEGATFQRK